MDGKFVYTYCSNWAERKDSEWSAYKKEKGISVSKPNMCTMCYMVSDNPTDPDSWVYKGVYGPHPGMGTNNNHSHLQKFQGNYYYIYHGAPLMESWQKAGLIDSKTSIFRSICVNKATVNEETQKISTVTPNLSGVTAIKNLNPFELQEAETMANSGGVMYEDYKNVKSNTKVNSLGNEVSENLYINMKAGAWTLVRNIDFGEEGAKSFMLRVKGTGKMEIRFSRKTTKAVATVEFSSSSWEDYVIDVDPEVFKGVQKNVFLVFIESDKAQFDAWQFSKEPSSGIITIHNADSQPTARYDLSGHRLTEGTSHHGIVIEQYQDANGVKRTRKRINSNR